MAQDRSSVSSAPSVVLDHKENRALYLKAEGEAKNFRSTQEKILNGTDPEKRSAFVYLMTQHYVRGRDWLLKEVKDENLRNLRKKLNKQDDKGVQEESKLLQPDAKHYVSAYAAFTIIYSALAKDEKHLSTEEQHTLSVMKYYYVWPANLKESQKLAELAANKGLAVAQHHLAVLCLQKDKKNL